MNNAKADNRGGHQGSKTNFMGEKVREAYTVPRVLLCLFLFFAVIGFVNDTTLAWYFKIATAILTAIVLRETILYMKVSKE